MSRRLDDWIYSYVTLTQDSEQPLSYNTWCAISCIAGALQRRVYLNWGIDNRIYPNMYIILVGPSGIGKSQAMRVAHDIFLSTELPTISSAITAQDTIVLQSKLEQEFVDQTGNKVQHSSITIFATELSVLLGQRNVQFLSYLTDWFDCHDEWRYDTKGAGNFEIIGVCVNIIGGSAPDWFSSMFPPEIIGGGFMSRVIFVAERKKSKIIPFSATNNKVIKLKKDLIYDLKEITKINGSLKLSEGARDFYVEYYNKEQRDIQDGKFPVPDTIFNGYCYRRALHLRKLAMIMAISRKKCEGTIEADDFRRALTVLQETEKKMPKAFGSYGKSDLTPIMSEIMEWLETNGEILRSNLLKAFHRDLDITTMESIESMLTKMGFMKVESVGGGDFRYKHIPQDGD